MSFPNYVRDVSRRYLAFALVLPLAAAVIAMAVNRVWLLNVVHLLAAAAWAGGALYLSGVLGPTLMGLEPPDRAKVTLPLIPRNVLLFSSVAAATLLTGLWLAEATFQDYGAPIVGIAYAGGLVLVVTAGYLIRLQGQIYREVHGSQPDMARVGKLAARVGKVGLVNAVLVFAVVAVMSVLRTGLA